MMNDSYIKLCFACGSPKVIPEKQSTGYNMTKGAVGAAIFGPVGAVAGVNGNTQTVWYCPECGARLTYTLPDVIVKSIFDDLEDPIGNAKSLIMKKRQYPNMPWPQQWIDSNGNKKIPSDVEIASAQKGVRDHNKQLVLDYVRRQNDWFTRDQVANATGLDPMFAQMTIGEMSRKGIIDIDKKQVGDHYYFCRSEVARRLQMEKDAKAAKEKARITEFWNQHSEEKKKLSDDLERLKKERNGIASEIKSNSRVDFTGYKTLIENLSKEIDALSEEYKKLGFFKAKRKKVVEEEIETKKNQRDQFIEVNKQIADIEDKLNNGHL